MLLASLTRTGEREREREEGEKFGLKNHEHFFPGSHWCCRLGLVITVLTELFSTCRDGILGSIPPDPVYSRGWDQVS